MYLSCCSVHVASAGGSTAMTSIRSHWFNGVNFPVSAFRVSCAAQPPIAAFKPASDPVQVATNAARMPSSIG